MNAERLLAHYERIADAPDAIPRLRRFILDLAVRGKLVEQNPNDEPASELLKRVAVEKARLVKTGEIRKRDDLPEITENEFPFTIPPIWCWYRLGGLGFTQTWALLHDSTAARVGALFQLLVQDTTAQDFGLPSSAIRLRM